MQQRWQFLEHVGESGKPYDNYQNCCKKDNEPFFGLESRAPDMTGVVEVASDAPEEGAVAEPVVEETP